MSDLVTVKDGGFTQDQVGLIKRQIAKDATDDELKLFLYQASKTGLDPLAKQIYFQKRNSKNGPVVTILTGIDGYRAVAERTGLYAGNDDPVFDDEERPRRATVTVWKLVGGVRCPFTATARWDQYYPGDTQGFMWKKMPHLMLGKCAEALALRKAFPNQLSGLYTKDEMEQANAKEETPAQAPQPPKIAQMSEQEIIDAAFSSTVTVYRGTDDQKTHLKLLMKRFKYPNDKAADLHERLLKTETPMGDLESIVEKEAKALANAPA